jgi:putative ABC transport system permease protein
VIWRSHDTNGRIYGITPELFTMLGFPILKGRFFTQRELEDQAKVVVIGKEVSHDLFGEEEPIGKSILINGQTMTVIGMTKQVAFKGYLGYVERGLMMPLPVVQSSLIASESPFGRTVGLVFLEAKAGESVDAVDFQVTNLMRLRHPSVEGKDDFFVGNSQQILDTFNSIAAALTIVLSLIAGISLVVGGINIMNIMLVSVTERTREIGLRKAIGASDSAILNQFMIESVLISLMGGLIGTALGMGLAQVIGNVSPLKPEVTLWSVILAVGVSGGVGLFFGVFPARRAAQLDPIVALRTD